MTIAIRLKDGRTIRVATNDPKQAVAVGNKIWADEQAKRPMAAKAWEKVNDWAGAFNEAVLPNWGDEIHGADFAIGAALKGKPIGEAFELGRKDFKQRQKALKAESPTAHAVVGGLGTVGGLLLPAGKALKGATMLQKVKQSAKVGAITGGIIGFGAGDDMQQRTVNAGLLGLTGGAVGAGMPPAIAGVRRAGVWARHNIPGANSAMTGFGNIPRAVLKGFGYGKGPISPAEASRQHADRLVFQAANRGHIQDGFGAPGPVSSPEAVQREVVRRQALTVPAIAGDVSEPLRELTSWASRGSGPGQEMVREALHTRKATESERVRQHITDTFGPAVDPIKATEDLVARSKDAAAPLYADAYAQPMQITADIQDLMRRPAFTSALPQAYTNIRNKGRDPSAMGFTFHPGTPDPTYGSTLPVPAGGARPPMGNPAPEGPSFAVPGGGFATYERGLSTEAFDQVARAISTAADKAGTANPLTGAVTHNTDSMPVVGVARQLKDAIAAQNEPYRQVNAMYADDMAQRAAMRQGQDIANLTGNEIAAQSRHMPDNAKEAWSIGARSALADQASQFGAKFPTGNTAASVRKSLGDMPKQEQISEMTGNTGAVRGLQDRLEAEHQGNILWSDVNGNSKTASRQALDMDLNETVQDAMPSSISPRGAVLGAWRWITNRASNDTRNAVKERIAKVMTESNPQTIEQLMADITDAARADQSFADLLHASGVTAAKAYARSLDKTTDPTMDAEDQE